MALQGREGYQMVFRRVAITLTAVLAVLELTSAANSETISDYWDNVALAYIQRTGSRPPIAARTLAVMHAAMYDAWTAYDPVAVPTRANGILKRPPEEASDSNKIEAISFAAHKALAVLLPSMGSSVDTALAELGYDLKDMRNADTSSPAGIGNVAAGAVMTLRQYDPPRYIAIDRPDPDDDPNAWQQVGGHIFRHDSAGSRNQ
jgi:hypothetical protein